MMGDVKDSFHKILGRPTDSPNRVIPRRSFSAPAELFDVDDQKKHCPLKMDEEEQDRLTNTVNTNMFYLIRLLLTFFIFSILF